MNPDSDAFGAAPAPTGKRRVLIVDDHPVFREAMSQVIEQESDLEVCGEAPNASLALEAVRQLRPDLALLDISLEGTNGIDLLKRMKAEQPALPVIILSMHDESLYALPSLRAGANGYVMKSEAIKQIVTAVRRVLDGEIHVSSEMGARLIFKAIHSQGDGSASPVDLLSKCELAVLELIGHGFASSEIARRLEISVSSLECHRLQIKEKLGCRTAGEVIRFAIDWTSQPNG